MNVTAAPTLAAAPKAAPTSTLAQARPEPPEDVVATSTAPLEENAGPAARLKHWFFTQKRVEGQETQGSPFNKLTFGMVLGAGAWATSKVIADIAASPTLGVALGKTALNVAALSGGYIAADLPSGLLHHWADNYADPNSKIAVVRHFAKQAQRHHYHPGDLGHYALSAWASPLSVVAWAPLAGVTALGASSPVLSAMTGLIGGMSVYGKFHEWSHTRPHENVPAIGRFLEWSGVAISPEAHNKHHLMPWNSDYCIVSGKLNPLLDKINFWPRYEKAIFHVTGKAPESWNVKEYKDFVDGKITKEEYISKAKDIMAEFKATEFKTRREKWGID